MAVSDQLVKNSLLIRERDVMSSNLPIFDYIMIKLEDAGAPIKFKSLTKCNTSEEDFEITAPMKLDINPLTGDLLYFWNK